MISFRQHSGVYTLEVSQFLKTDMNEAWKFFSSPENLAAITPPGMGFVITSGQPEKMFLGQIITYKVSPFPGFVTNWITEITHVLAGSYFVDEQRFGPYQMWHHIHRFEEKQSGVLMTDQVSYKLPFGFIGRIAHGLFVKAQLKRIFEFREQKLNELFNT